MEQPLTAATPALSTAKTPLGYVDWDGSRSSNDRIVMRSPFVNRPRIIRDQYVRIEDPQGVRTGFLGRIVAGPFFSPRGGNAGGAPFSLNKGLTAEVGMLTEIELLGELVNGQTRATKTRPIANSIIQDLNAAEVTDLLGLSGDMLLGAITGQGDIWIRLQSKNKNVLPRNVGIFGTVGSGKSNSAQVLIEEAAANGYAVIVLDVESEYVNMDGASQDETLLGGLTHFGKTAVGLVNFQVFHPASCASEREDSEPMTLRLADFDSAIVAELLQTTLSERNALLDCIEHLEGKARTKIATSDQDGRGWLLNPAADAMLPYTLRSLKDRATERSGRSNEFFDYTGLASKLLWLLQSGAFDQPKLRSLDAERMMKPGRVTVIDVSIANDIVKNMATADLLRKVFAYKVAHPETPPTMLVIEEAHSFISKEKAQTMHATLQMLRNVARRGRKRWLSLAFVSQQPGHLPPEIFELCNTRIVHTLRSLHNLEALMTTAGDVGRELWERCPLLGPGEAIVTSPQFTRPVVVSMRPAQSLRRFIR